MTTYTRVVDLLAFSLYLSITLCASTTCDYREGEQPVPVLNSNYSIVNGNFCCPLNHADSNCKTEQEMMCLCPHGLVLEPCRHCKTCAKGLGEECGGLYGINGECMNGLRCSADRKIYLDGNNVTGICYNPALKEQFERCGGVHGDCKEGLSCIEVVGEHMCIVPSTIQKPVCFKNCTDRKKDVVCGTDGRLYDNICHLRQATCPGRYVRAEASHLPCTQNACKPMSAPSNGSVVYRSGNVLHRSNMTINCNSGFEAEYDTTPNIVLTFPANLTCVCGSRGCAWRYGPKLDKPVTFEDLPRCINTREKNCQKEAEDSEETPKRKFQNSNRSNSA